MHCKLFEVAIAQPEQFECFLSHSAHLRVVFRVEGDLFVIEQIYFMERLIFNK